MAKKVQEFNPFYSVLVVAGVAFLLTACMYGVVAVKKVDPLATAVVPARDAPVVEFFDRRGPLLLLVELALLGVASVAAMATDGYWTRRAKKASQMNEGDGSD